MMNRIKVSVDIWPRTVYPGWTNILSTNIIKTQRKSMITLTNSGEKGEYDMTHTKWKDIVISSLQEYNAEMHRITIESIQQAMIELLKTEMFEKITIQQLVKKAGVSRSAFYKNFCSKEEVLQSIVYDRFSDLANKLCCEITSPTRDAFQKIMQNMIEQCREFYSVMQADAWRGGTLLQCMNEYFSDFISLRFPEGDEMRMRFCMGGMYNVIQYWVDSGMKESPEELSVRLMQYMADKDF